MRRLIGRCDPPQTGFQTNTDLAKNSEILDSQISCKRPIQAKNGSNLCSVCLALLYTNSENNKIPTFSLHYTFKMLAHAAKVNQKGANLRELCGYFPK